MLTSILATFTAVPSILLILPYLLYYRYLKHHLTHSHFDPKRLQREVKVSVLVCTLNEARSIEGKLKDILSQNIPLKQLDLLAVDGGSTDGTVEILKTMADKLGSTLSMRVIAGGNFTGKASQINEGFRAAKGDIVVTTDADVRMHPEAIRILVDSVLLEGVGAVCARQVLTNPHDSPATETETTYRGFYEFLRVGESNLHSTPIFHGGLSAFRREAFSKIGEDVNADDTQLALAAIRKGFRAIYDPRSIFYTRSPSEMRSSWRQRVRRGQGIQRVFWRNRDMILTRRFGRFSFPIFAAEFYMHLISPFLFVATAVLLLTLFSQLPLLALILAVLTCLGLVIQISSKRVSPVTLFASFALYQAALFWAAILHLLGYDHRRWSTRR